MTEADEVQLASGLVPISTPGDALLLDFIKPMGLSQNGLARAIGVAPRCINEIVLGKRVITANTALRLERYFGLSEGYWLRAQNQYDIRITRREIDDKLLAIVPYHTAA